MYFQRGSRWLRRSYSNGYERRVKYLIRKELSYKDIVGLASSVNSMDLRRSLQSGHLVRKIPEIQDKNFGHDRCMAIPLREREVDLTKLYMASKQSLHCPENFPNQPRV